MKVDMDHVVGLVLLSPRAGAFNADNLGYSYPKTDANFSFGLKVRNVNMHVYAIERHLTRKPDVKMTDEDGFLSSVCRSIVWTAKLCFSLPP